MILRAVFGLFILSAFPVCYAQDVPHENEFSVYVPNNYDSAEPAGLLVYVSPIDTGAVPDAWKNILDQRNMIWVSINGSGNTKPPEQRIAEARIARSYILKNYEVEPERVYISGMSGGGQIATIAASRYPELFSGGVFLCGVNPWSERDVNPWQENLPDNIDAIRRNRYVFLSGTEDFKLAATARVYRLYKKAGIENSKLIVVEDMGHELPDTENFDKALGFVDGRKL